MELSWSAGWVIESGDDSTLILSAGADRRVALDGLEPTLRARAEKWQSDGWSPAAGAEALTDRLVELGVLVPDGAERVELVGDPMVLGVLAPETRGPPRLSGAGTEPGLVVAVRTGRDWPDVPAGRLHLGLDLALHHTIVLGPLVVPGASACLGCLDGRMAHRWPAPVVPPEPAVQRSLAVAAALLQVQVDLVAAGTSPLVNATIAWDLERGTTERQKVYKVVGCPRCDVAPPAGRVHLGWEA